jgi:purine catabolism regulator
MITVKEFADELEKDKVFLVGGKENVDQEITYLTSLELTEKTSRIKGKGFIMTTFHAFKDINQILHHLEWFRRLALVR